MIHVRDDCNITDVIWFVHTDVWYGNRVRQFRAYDKTPVGEIKKLG